MNKRMFLVFALMLALGANDVKATDVCENLEPSNFETMEEYLQAVEECGKNTYQVPCPFGDCWAD